MLTSFVSWFFDKRGDWQCEALEPVVLTSGDPSKYSAHVVYPQVQFKNYKNQSEYMSVMLSALSAVQVDRPDGSSKALLAELVDTAPYSPFQLLRGPYACKLKNGELDRESCLEPEGHFRSDPLAYFAGHVDAEYALPLPSVGNLLSVNEELRHYRERYLAGLRHSSGSRPGRCSFQDEANLFHLFFSMAGDEGVLDLSRLSDVEKYEVALERLHHHRASQWWSWFRISGVTNDMLRRYGSDPELSRRIWSAHMKWSSGFPDFDEKENKEMVFSCDGRPVSGLNLLLRLLRFDNPGLNVIESQLTMAVPRSL
eukprot:SRR837773.3114.p1 GENE.SRR837773.3114~~SRR837773.3114.p1  ORF type:complete len:312 (+),score=53.83 SRR837773.3114:399-1334(+)